MKLAIATFATTLALATGASAMVGPYERAVDNADAAPQLFTQGDSAYDEAHTRSTSPEADWTVDGTKKVTVFEASGDAVQGSHFGAGSR